MNIDVMFYNVQLIFPGYIDHERAHKLRTFLIQSNCDVIGLCEVYQPTLRRILLDDQLLEETYPYRLQNVDGGGKRWLHSGLVLLSKLPIRSFKRVEYDAQLPEAISFNLFTKRDLLFAEVETQPTSVGIFLTHLQYGILPYQYRVRNEQIDEISTIVSKLWDINRPTIVMGDFNVMSQDKQYARLISQLFPLVDWWPIKHPGEPGYTYDSHNTRKIFLKDTRLDYIFSSTDLLPQELELVHPNWSVRSLVWQPNEGFSLITRFLIHLTIILRILDLPKALLMEISRKFHGLPPRYSVDHDLSDHYPLRGLIAVKEPAPRPFVSDRLQISQYYQTILQHYRLS